MLASRQPARPALDRNSLPHATAVLPGYRHMFERKSNVVGNKQIEMPVAIIIDEAASRTPACIFVQQACGFRDIRKSSITVISIQTVLPEASDENVIESVIVVIGNANARTPPSRLQSGLYRDIGKGAIAIVLIETIGGTVRCALKPCAG